MQVHGRGGGALRGGDACHVVDVGVRQEDMTDRQPISLGEREQQADFVARIDDRGLPRLFAAHHVAVLQERADRLALNYHDPMILAVLDDLMFTSKIKTTASQLGVPVTFARSADAALAEMRKTPPSLVILDLNNPRTNPLAIVASMKQDAALAAIRTVGYASHVQTDVINAARQAGVDEVLARSAFTQHLASILGPR